MQEGVRARVRVINATAANTSKDVVLLHAFVSPLPATPQVPLHTHISKVTEYVRESVLALVCACSRGTINAQELQEGVASLTKLRSLATADSTYRVSHTVTHTNNGVIDFLLDTGSNAHITNDMSVFIPGVQRSREGQR